jgi:hypothetical protein
LAASVRLAVDVKVTGLGPGPFVDDGNQTPVSDGRSPTRRSQRAADV